MALRGGRASSCEGELGTSVGLVLDRMNEYEYCHKKKKESFFVFRLNPYVQFPKNPIVDCGIGGDIGLSSLALYLALGRDIGNNFAIYNEIRYIMGIANAYTVGCRINVFKHFSLFVETNIFAYPLLSEEFPYDREGTDIAKTIGIGLSIHSFLGK